MKTCSAEEQGPIVFRCLTGRAKVAAHELSVAEIGAADGLKNILDKLDKLYLPEKNQKICAVLERFENFKRLPNMNMASFTCEFERLHNQLKDYGCTYPDGVLAYRLMKSSNISKEHEQLCRATVETAKWGYETVLQQLRKIFNDFTASKVESGSSDMTDRPIKLEDTYMSRNYQTQDCYFGRNNFEDDQIHYQNFDEDEDYDMEPSFQQGYREPDEYDIYYGPSNKSPWKWNSRRQSYPSSRGRNYQGNRRPNSEQQNYSSPRNFQRNSESAGSNSSKQNPYVMNPKDYRGNPTVCRKCRSTFHWWENCPHVTPQEKANSSKQRVLYNDNTGKEDLFIALFQKSTPTTSDGSDMFDG